VQVGAVFPQLELSGDPDAVRRFGIAVEQLGYKYLLAYDHILGAEHAGRKPPLPPNTGTEKDSFHDPIVLFSYLAGVTERLQFATGVLVLPSRPTVLVARQVADLDLVSGERLRLGVGIGRNHVEYEAVGTSFATRAARQEEQIGLLRRLWTEPLVDFTGRFDRIERASQLPHPTRLIPIWLGGWGSRAYDRAARLADGFIFHGPKADVATAWTSVRGLVTHYGRSLEEFGGEYIMPTVRDPREVADGMRHWHGLGGTHSSVVTMGLGLDSVEAHVDYLGQMSKELELERLTPELSV
jgi:probable F420-dependent oxidoreductase